MIAPYDTLEIQGFRESEGSVRAFRFGTVSDPFGHVWSIATHTEDLSPEEIAERSKAAMAEMAGGT